MYYRNNNREKLERFDLCQEIFEDYNLKVYDVAPVRNVFMVSTDKGNKILKLYDCTIDELKFIYDVVEYIKVKFPRIVQFIKNKEGDFFTIRNNDMYCIVDTVMGRECDFFNPLDIKTAAQGLGELHLAAEGFKNNLKGKNTSGELIGNFIKAQSKIKFLKNIANMHEVRTEFDDIFISKVDYYNQSINNSIEILNNSAYYKLCSEEDKIIVCHHDLAHHNILIKDDDAYFIDFDYAVIDLKIHDLCNLINKVIKNFAFDINKAEAILLDYSIFNTLNTRELEVLYGMLTFPGDFYNISYDYYTRRKNWEEEIFLDKLKRKVEFEEDRQDFLKKFKNELLN